LSEGIGVIPWSPLARGFLAGGRTAPGQGETERGRTDELSSRMYYRQPDFEIVDAVTDIAKAHGVPNMQIALAWVLRHPAVTSPIVGATKPHHLDDAIAALSVKLTDEDVERLHKLYKPKPVIDHQ
jgi:aryl-alcohol dehydrogenase-like predicted oxidoreductase